VGQNIKHQKLRIKCDATYTGLSYKPYCTVVARENVILTVFALYLKDVFEKYQLKITMGRY